MRIVEYRIFMPLKFEQCKVASNYAVARRMKENTKDGEGFQVIKDEEQKDGHYIYRIMHLKSKMPQSLRWALQEKYSYVHEQNYDAFPIYKGKFSIPGMGSYMTLETSSNHHMMTDDRSIPDNLTNMSEEDLSIREIVYLDILNGPKGEYDIHGFSNKEAGIEEMKGDYRYNDATPPAWIKDYHGPLTLVVKVVKFEFIWFGLQTTVESVVLDYGFYYQFLDTHRAMVLWSREWGKMSEEECNEQIAKTYASLSKSEFY